MLKTTAFPRELRFQGGEGRKMGLLFASPLRITNDADAILRVFVGWVESRPGRGSAGLHEKTAVADVPPDDAFAKSLDEMIDYTANRRLTIKDHAAWQIIHGAEAFGKDFLIDADGKTVKAVEYATNGGPMRGWNLRPTEHGVFAPVEPGAETGGMGHYDQWLGYLSQCGIQLSDPLIVGGKNYTINAFLTNAQWEIIEDPDYDGTWTLMAFITYLPLDATWKNKFGEDWNLERLVAKECRKNNEGIYGEACGGTHCLYSLALAVKRYQQETGAKTLPEPWKTADDRVQRAIHDARANQNADGSMSSNSFIRASSTPDVAQQIRTTGHVLEFLCVALNDEQFREPWVTRAAASLTKNFEYTKVIPMECGALYHAAHSLMLYRTRRFGPRAPQVPEQAPASAEPKT